MLDLDWAAGNLQQGTLEHLVAEMHLRDAGYHISFEPAHYAALHPELPQLYKKAYVPIQDPRNWGYSQLIRACENHAAAPWKNAAPPEEALLSQNQAEQILHEYKEPDRSETRKRASSHS